MAWLCLRNSNDYRNSQIISTTTFDQIGKFAAEFIPELGPQTGR